MTCDPENKFLSVPPQILEVKVELLHLGLKGCWCSPGPHPSWGAGSGLKPSPPCLEQSLGQILEAAVNVSSRTLEVQLDALLAALHAQVGWG